MIPLLIASGGAVAIYLAAALGLGFVALLKKRPLWVQRRRRPHYGRRGSSRYGREAKEADDLQRTLDMIRQKDVIGCGLRLMCDLAAAKPHLLRSQELDILNLVRPPVTPGEGPLPPGATGDYLVPKSLGGAGGDYLVAKSLGAAGGDCGKTFPLCPLNGSQIMERVLAYLP